MNTNSFKKIRNFMQSDNIGIALILFFLCLITSVINPNFLSEMNIINLLRKLSLISFISIGMTFVMIGGGIDLSSGAMAGLGGIIAGSLMFNGTPVLIAIFIAIFVGVIIGTLNGFLIAKVNIPAFIVTLGTLYIAEGLVNVISLGKPIYPLPDIFNVVFSKANFLGIPLSVFLMVFFAIFMHYLLNHTVYGRSLTACGGNEKAAITAGINSAKIKLISYATLGGISAFTGLLIAGEMRSSHPSAGGGWELTAIAAAVIGGTSVTGGVGSVLGTLIGAAIMAVLEISMVMLKISVYYQNIIVGAIIIGAVVFDKYKNLKKS